MLQKVKLKVQLKTPKTHNPHVWKAKTPFKKSGKQFYAGFTLSDAKIHIVHLPISSGQSQSQPLLSLQVRMIPVTAPVQNDLPPPL